MKILKKDLIDIIHERTGLYKKDIHEVFTVFKDIIYEELKEGNEISLKNMFTIKTVETKAGEKFNPYINQYEYRDEHRTVKIYPSTKLRTEIREYDAKDIEEDEEYRIEKQIAMLMARKQLLKDKKKKGL